MNLLIVDDLSSVVKGLENGIAWKMLGISNVFTAYNAFEARKILEQHPIHIMLCDVEMPQENGIQLLTWMRSENMDTECIFLTAHADFEYMKEAIRINGFDYILQPAPYDEIRKAVYRAMQKIMEKQKHDEVYSYGKALMNHQDNMKRYIFHELLANVFTMEKYEEYTRAISLPEWNQCGYPILIQIDENGKKLEKMNLELLQFIISNICGELLSGYEQEHMIYAEQKSIFYLFIYGRRGYQMDFEGIKRQMRELLKNIQNFLTEQSMLYIMEETKTCDFSATFQKLEAMCRKNVMLKQGFFVFSEIEKKEKTGVRQNAFLKRWREYLGSGCCEAVKNEMITYLTDLGKKEQLNEAVLHHFYIDFVYIINDYIVSNNIDRYQFMETTQNPECYQEATKNLPNMLSFIEQVFEKLEQESEPTEIAVGEFIRQYVHDHISQEIKRADIADQLHLNVDYLARVFKKETDIPLKEYIFNEKMKVARNLIQTTALPLSVIASKVGYDNFSHFSQSYKKMYGVSPSMERKKDFEKSEI